MEINRNFWKDKKVLITGHTGFKGSWLSLWLQECGAELIGYSVGIPTTPSLFDVARVSDGMISIFGDVRDLNRIKGVMEKYEPAIVIHLAAQAIVRKGYEDPVGTYSTNVMGTVNVLEAVRHSGSVRAALMITSDKCYENREWHWGYRENDPMGGHDPYSSSKGCAELVVSAYTRSFFGSESLGAKPVFVASARAGNVIGGGDWAKDRLVPDTMRAILERQPVVVRYPGSTRPWQHVLEPLRGYLLLLENLWVHGSDFVGAWNFGPDDRDAKTVSWIAEMLTGLWGDGASWTTDSTKHPHEATYLKLDCSKAKSLLSWMPRLNITQALEWIVEWYKGYSGGATMRQVTLGQIARYEEILRDHEL